MSGAKRESVIDDFRAVAVAVPMTRGEVATVSAARASLWPSTFLVWTSFVPTSPIHNHNPSHASSTARVEEGQNFFLLPIAPALTCIQYLDRRLFVQLNGSRKVIGVLRGYDVCFLSFASVDPVC